MAEVSGKLPSGVYRLSALRYNRSRAVCAGRSLGSLPLTRSFSVKEDSAQDQREAQLQSRRAARRKSAKLCTVQTCQAKQENETRFIGFFETTQSHQTAPYFSERLQPALQEMLLSCRRTFWTGETLSLNPDAFRSPQQQRAFCSIVLLLAEQGSGRPRCGMSVNYPRRHHTSSATGRSYSWGSGSRSTDVPLVYRSRTAYYDILKVSPSATQSQIKTAYYKQSFIYHPDKNPGSKEAIKCFSEISEAYSVLGNIDLRRKYDRGILSQSDVQSAGRSPSKEATSRTTGPSQQHQQRARPSSRPGGKTVYDFDAFYQAHYGAQLQKERDMRARKAQMSELEKQKLQQWRERKVIQMTVSVLLAMAGLIFVNITRS